MAQTRFPKLRIRGVVGGSHRRRHGKLNGGLRRLCLFPLWPLCLTALAVLSGGCQNNPFAEEPPISQAARAALTGDAGVTVNVPRRAPQSAATVAVIKDDAINYSSMVSQALESALGPGGISNLVSSGKTVLIKPNLVSNKALAVTDWHVVKALVDQIKAVNGGAEIVIAEGSASNATTTTRTIMEAQGYTAANFPGVTLVDLNDTTLNPTNTYVLADATTGVSKKVAAIIRNADVYIDMPKMKTHYHAGFTGAVKNLGIGTPPWTLWNIAGSNTNKGGLHHDIRSEIVDHIQCRVPDLSIMDAIQGMEGQGPASGTAVTMNLVLASKDPVALDTVACNIMGIPPSLITHLVFAANENIGVMDMNNITVAGNTSIAAVQRNFTRATPGATTPPYELGAIPYRATTVIRPTPGTMAINGDLGEWGYANTLTADASFQVKGTGSGFGGASDASFKAQLMYDVQNLYLAVNVKDDVKLANNAVGSAIANGDGIEVYLSTYPEQYNASRGTTYNAQYDYHLAISYADSPQAYLLSHGVAPTGFVASKVETSDGYIIEAKIPWSNFGSPTVSPTATTAGSSSYTEYVEMGVNLAANDADGSPTTLDHKIIWGNAKDSDIETNPLKMGMSYVDPPGGLYATPAYTLSISATNGVVVKTPDAPTYDANTTVSLTAAPNSGYVFAGWTGDANGTANPLTVTMSGNKSITANFQVAPVLTSITVTPANSTVASMATQQFSAVANDQNGNPLSPQPAFTWNVSGGGIVSSSGLFTAGVSTGGPFTVTAQSGSVSGAASISIVLGDTAPTIVNAAAATPNPVTGSSAALSVLGDDDGSEANLTYTWATAGTPPAAVAFSTNGTNAAKSTTATFTKAGNYTFQVTVRDQSNQTATSSVAVTVSQTLTSILVSPTTATVVAATTQQFSATARDQFAANLTTQPAFTWTVSGGGTIGASGLFTAGTTAGGPYTVTASSGTVSGTSSVTITAAVATPVYQINCGSSSAVSPFTADQYSSGGTMRTVTNAITTTGVVNPAPQAVYQSERYGNVTYTLPNLVASTQYTVRLHFAELYQTATGKRTFNVLINDTTVLSAFDIFATAGARYKAVVREFTATANATGQIVIKLNTVVDNATISGIEIIRTTPNSPPTISTAAAANPNPVTGTTAALTVLGADDGGEAALAYAWATTGTPPAAVTFSVNGTNAAKATTATFTKAGSYNFQVTVKDAGNQTSTSSVVVNVSQTLTSIVTSPTSATVATTGTQQFTATARDQFATNLTSQPTFTWTVSGGGTVASSGLFTAGTTAGGPFTVTATSGSASGTASVTVAAVNAPPTIAAAAAASPNPVTGSTAALSVLGADDAGEANLTYTWATTGTPPAAVAFSANGSNAAKATTATFTKAGSYTFQVTVKDGGNQTATSSVAVTVNQTLTSIVVAPASVTIATSTTQLFTATGRDQFTTNLTTQPSFTWSVSGGGTIASSGLFTAGTTAGGPYAVTAKSGTITGTASITISAPATAIYRINCGSTSAASPFTADQYSSGGTIRSVTNTINLTGATNAAPQAVYQTERYGNVTYTLPSLVASAKYTVRLHFAELYQTASGKRTFNVLINGATVLSAFDIFAAAGANYKAVVREFTATANTSGQIVVKLNTVVDNATINGIEIIRQ